jgi:hypothetical protein
LKRITELARQNTANNELKATRRGGRLSSTAFPGKNSKLGFDLYSLGEDGQSATGANDPDGVFRAVKPFGALDVSRQQAYHLPAVG